MSLRVLIACEFSGIVRDAFTARGHDVWSCDLLPTESPGQHIQGDVLEILNDGWDLIIAHPPCTYFSRAGMHYLKTHKGRQERLNQSFEFLLSLWESSIDKICIENTAGWLSTNWTRPNQIIQPYYFGDEAIKTTCLWLKNLPPLVHFESDNLFGKKTHVSKGKWYYWKGGRLQEWYQMSHIAPKARGHLRSQTFPGIANAMAEQWG